MFSILLLLLAFFAFYFTYFVYIWRNTKCINEGVLPPGSMGLPLIGETLEFLSPSYSLDVHSFIKKRIHKYGPIFRTNIGGHPVIISAEPKFNSYIQNQEGRLVVFWYLGRFAKIFNFAGGSSNSASGLIHKKMRSMVLSHLGHETIQSELILKIEEMVNKNLRSLCFKESVNVKRALSSMVLNFTAMQFFGYDAENSPDNFSEKFSQVAVGPFSFPLNLPGTVFHKSLKDQKKVFEILEKIIQGRRESANNRRADLLNELLELNDSGVVSDKVVVYHCYGLLFASHDTVTTVMTLAFKLLSDHPAALQELEAEHEAILRSRRNPNSSLTWMEYKSMTFTTQVINESLRLASIAPGMLRRAIKDIHYEGYTIPNNWAIIALVSAYHVKPDIYKDPLEFNPWRWKDLDPHTISKNFSPFGDGGRQCAGADFARAVFATFLHVLVTKYRWKKIKEGKVYRRPLLGFGDGIHVKFFEKH